MLSTQAGIALGALNSLRAPGPVRYVDEMRILLVAIGAAMLISGCGSVATGSSPSPSPTPSTSPNLNFDVAVSEKDRTATMRVGQKLEVVLHANTGMTNWAQPKSSDESILVPIVDPAATAARGVTLAAFQAKSTGQADITAYAGPVCSPGLACPMYVVVFSVRVTVTA
jgi:phage tail protein X